MQHEYYMNLAIELAKAGEYQTLPNPCVGAVIVKDNNIVGLGSHLKAGSAHAEIHALNMALDKAKGATLYVTLEPCNHYGKTTPCTEAIIKSGITAVYIASIDKNPKVCGGGVKALEDAGIKVISGFLESKVSNLNQIFNVISELNRPFITIKVGMSLDAKLATKTLESKWITNSEARVDAHIERSNHDAILVGINTVLLDDPSLNVRVNSNGKYKNPIRIVLDNQLKTPLESNIVKLDHSRVYIFINDKVSLSKIDEFKKFSHIKIVQLNADIDIKDVCKYLLDQNIYSILVEGGNTVISEFIDKKYIDRCITYIAPMLIGGIGAPNFYQGNGVNCLNDSINLKFIETKLLGDNFKIVSEVVIDNG